MNAEARVPPAEEKGDALGSDEFTVSKKCEDLVAEEELGLVGVDEGNGKPGSVREEEAASDDGVDVRVPLQYTAPLKVEATNKPC
jgi:hypothetical protein